MGRQECDPTFATATAMTSEERNAAAVAKDPPDGMQLEVWEQLVKDNHDFVKKIDYDMIPVEYEKVSAQVDSITCPVGCKLFLHRGLLLRDKYRAVDSSHDEATSTCVALAIETAAPAPPDDGLAQRLLIDTLDRRERTPWTDSSSSSDGSCPPRSNVEEHDHKTNAHRCDSCSSEEVGTLPGAKQREAPASILVSPGTSLALLRVLGRYAIFSLRCTSRL